MLGVVEGTSVEVTVGESDGVNEVGEVDNVVDGKKLGDIVGTSVGGDDGAPDG